MFIIEITYKASLQQVDEAMKDHMMYLQKYYNQELFLLSGRKDPRKGGIILVNGSDAKEVRKVAREDPFYKMGLSKFRLIAFNASQANKHLAKIIKP
jgi:uncharacterized protein YciI